MPPDSVGPPFDQFLAAAEAVTRARPEVDPEMAHEVLQEAARCSTTVRPSTVWTHTTLMPLSLRCASISSREEVLSG